MGSKKPYNHEHEFITHEERALIPPVQIDKDGRISGLQSACEID